MHTRTSTYSLSLSLSLLSLFLSFFVSLFLSFFYVHPLSSMRILSLFLSFFSLSLSLSLSLLSFFLSLFLSFDADLIAIVQKDAPELSIESEHELFIVIESCQFIFTIILKGKEAGQTEIETDRDRQISCVPKTNV